jgi:hypothetical protein
VYHEPFKDTCRWRQRKIGKDPTREREREREEGDHGDLLILAGGFTC